MFGMIRKYKVQAAIACGAIAVTLIIVFMAMAGVFSEGPSKGWVTNKDYTPARDWVMYIPGTETCSSFNNQRTCTRTPDQWIPQHSNKSWELEIDDHNGNKGWRDVDEDTYHRCQVDQYCDTKE